MFRKIKKIIKYFSREEEGLRYWAKKEANHESQICYRFEPIENITSYEAAECIKAITLSRYATDREGAIISDKAFDNLGEKTKRHWLQSKTKAYIFSV